MALPYKFRVQTIIEEERTSLASLQAIKKWLKLTPLPQLQEEFIILFLLSSRNDIETTKNTIEAYFRITKKAPDLFNNFDMEASDIKNSLKVVKCCVIPRKMDNNTVVLFGKLNDTNYRNFDLTALVKLCGMLLHLCQICDPPNEVVAVVDVKGLSFMHLTCLRLGSIVTPLEYVQEAMPLKLRNVHILNSNYVFEKILNFIKIFMTNELITSVKTYSPKMNMTEFQKKWVPASCMPKEYGGDLPCLEELMGETVEELKDMKSFFEEERKLRNLHKT